MSQLFQFFGLDNGAGAPYLFWSGIGSDIAEVAILGGVIQMYRRHTCAVRGCWRIGLRRVPGTDHTACHRHHPHPKPTHAELLAEHEASKA